jgi:hypothetical protein
MIDVTYLKVVPCVIFSPNIVSCTNPFPDVTYLKGVSCAIFSPNIVSWTNPFPDESMILC